VVFIRSMQVHGPITPYSWPSTTAALASPKSSPWSVLRWALW